MHYILHQKVQLWLQNLILLVGIKISYYSVSTQSHTIGVPPLPSMNQKPHHKGIDFGNTLHTTSPKRKANAFLNFNFRKLEEKTRSITHRLNHHHNRKEVTKYKQSARGNTDHPTHPNLGYVSRWMGNGSIHYSQWISLAHSNYEAWWWSQFLDDSTPI